MNFNKQLINGINNKIKMGKLKSCFSTFLFYQIIILLARLEWKFGTVAKKHTDIR